MESNKIKKVLFFFDSRATFSYSYNIIKFFKKKKYTSIVSGNYLEKNLELEKKFSLITKLKLISILDLNHQIKINHLGLYLWVPHYQIMLKK